MSNTVNFYALEPLSKKAILEAFADRGICIGQASGMCGEIYIFDQGPTVYPRYTCAKIPKQQSRCSIEETAERFVNEIEKQLSFYHHMFVHCAIDFAEVMGVPVAYFRYWGSDLDKLIRNNDASEIEKLSIMVYICNGLQHCRSEGLVTHQDLKPANIFLRNIKPHYPDLPDLDIYNFAMVADFGLANAWIDSGIYDGSRPYMAPEQWNEEPLTPATDIFALGVIFYQLITGGYHPIGIKLQDFWPHPLPGNSKKWLNTKPWQNWAKGGCEIKNSGVQAEPDLSDLFRRMFLFNPIDRPSLDEVNLILLQQIKARSEEGSIQIEFLIKYFNERASNEALDVEWPHLSKRWLWFKSRFGKT